MNDLKTPSLPRWPGWRIVFLAVFIVVIGGTFLAALTAIHPAAANGYDLHIGTVAPVDLVAPISITFESEVLTLQQREAAARAVPPVYTPPDTRIARQQVDALRNAVAFISTVRADAFATPEQKLEDITLLRQDFPPSLAEEILNLTDEEWQAVQTESILVLQQIMRTAIRESQLEDARRSLPTLVSFSLPEEHVPVVANLVSLYVAPNSFYNETLTEERRQQAREAVAPVQRSFVAGETVVRQGKLLNELDLEALQQLGLLASEGDPLTVFTAGVVVVLALALILLFLYRRRGFSRDFKHVLYTTAFFTLFLFAGRLMILDGGALPYLFPMTAFGLLIGALFGPQPGLFFLIPLSVLTTFGMPDGVESALFYILSGVFGVLMLDRAQRVIVYIWAGLGAGAAGAVTLLTFHLLDPFTNLTTLSVYAGASLLNGLTSGILALLLLFLTASLLGKVTIIQLTELSRPDHPLLRFVLMNAPGTYQHSLQVANLAEQAAERIGADPLLTRIGALYHDVGKANAPQYFIENQIPGARNPHETLDPAESSAIIIRHVTDGIELARKNRLPERIIDFIAEHHGTTVTRYQYIEAVKAAEAGAEGQGQKISQDDFRYPGPRPRSRETALVMLADGCEARARAERPGTEADVKHLIEDVFRKRIADGQLNEAPITLHELHIAGETFANTLRGIYHARLEYPKMEEPPDADEEEFRPEPAQKSEKIRPVRDLKIPEPAGPVPPHDPSAN